MLIEPAIAVLASTPATLRAMLVDLPNNILESTGGEGWAARDVVAHLSLRQRPAIIGRIEAIMANPGGPIPGVPNDTAKQAELRLHDFDDLFRGFDTERQSIIAFLRNLRPGDMNLAGVHSEVGSISVADVIHHVAYHDLVHIAQAAELVAAPIEKLRGGLRAFR